MYRRENGSEGPNSSIRRRGKCRGLRIVDRFWQVLIAEERLKSGVIKIVLPSAPNAVRMEVARPGSLSKRNEYESDRDYRSSLTFEDWGTLIGACPESECTMIGRS